jgi:hypothetical protein
MSATKFANLFETLAAITKKASDPETSHPIGSADDGTTIATEGAHSSENTAELKSGLGSVAVPAAPDNPVEPEKLDLGTTVTGSGEAPPEGKPQDKPKDSEISPTDPTKIASIADLVKLGASLNTGIKNLMGANTSSPQPKVESTSTTEMPANTKVEGKSDAKTASNGLTDTQKQVYATMTKAAAETATKVVQYLIGFKKSADDAAMVEAAAPEVAAAGPEADPAAGAGVDPKAQALALIVQIMQEAGLTPEDLLAALGNMAGPSAGGAPAPEAAAAAPAAEGAAPEMTVSAGFSLAEIKRAFDLLSALNSDAKSGK